MTYLSFLAHLISQRRATFLILLLIVSLVFAQPLLVNAKPAARNQSQLAELAQITPTPRAEATEEATDKPTEEPSDEGDAKEPATATAEPTEVITDVLNVEIPTSEATEEATAEEASASAESDSGYALPFGWQGETTIPAQELGNVAPPLQAEVIEGDFHISFVEAESGDVLRILPVPADGVVGSVRVGLKFEPTSSVLPFPAGQVVVLQVSARVYAPDASARLSVADDSGSSSVLLEGLNWTNYQITRQIAADATSLEIMLEWQDVPANGWLEMRGLNVSLLPTVVAAALSPTDTPSIIEAVTIEPTVPPPAIATAAATPTDLPTPTEMPTARVIPTATPLPDIVATEVPTVEATTLISDALPSATPTLIIVTSTPTPVDIYEQATRVAQATDWARILGPSTPTPPNLATPTPTITPIIVTNTPTPANEATATQLVIYATAVAFTTGTPTPMPANATVLVATLTPIPPTAVPKATATPTPIFVLVDDLPVADPSATPSVPAILEGKIVFLSSFRGNPRAPNAMVMNPDGTGVGLLTTNYFHSIVAGRDAYSADSRYRVYSLREAGGTAHNAGLIQLFYDDDFYDSTQHQLTYFGAGVAWSPAWSPTSETIALVSSESGNDEIWVAQRGQWPPTQLTKNDWEWDHHPSFSPDGSQIVFASNRVTGRRQLWLMDSSGGDQRQLTNFTFEAWDPVWVKYVSPPTPEQEGCNANYSGACIPLGIEDIDCGAIGQTNFKVVGSDPYGLDKDNDGIACEQ